MDALDGILYGLSVAFTFNNLLAALVGALAGTLIGVYFEQRHISELRAIIKKLLSNSLSIDN
jgi:ABC-type lipoprotein release transport system permease subunit